MIPMKRLLKTGNETQSTFDEIFALSIGSATQVEQLLYASCGFPNVGKGQGFAMGKRIKRGWSLYGFRNRAATRMFSEREKLLYTIVHMAKYTI